MTQQFHLRVYEEKENTNLKRYMNPMFIYSSEDVEAATVSVSWSVDGEGCVCVCVYTIENTASNILITVYHDMVMTYLWDHFLLYKNIKLLCTPETNRILCINCTSIKKKMR